MESKCTQNWQQCHTKHLQKNKPVDRGHVSRPEAYCVLVCSVIVLLTQKTSSDKLNCHVEQISSYAMKKNGHVINPRRTCLWVIVKTQLVSKSFNDIVKIVASRALKETSNYRMSIHFMCQNSWFRLDFQRKLVIFWPYDCKLLHCV